MKPFYFISKLTFSFVFRLLYGYRVYGSERIPLGPAIIASSHSSYLDPILVGVAIKEEIHFLAKQELFTVRFLCKAIRGLNAHPISGTTQDLASFRLVGQLMKGNKKVVIFPEGERTLSGNLAPIKPGIGMLAQRNRCSIVPVYIHGAYTIWPAYQRFPKLWGKIAVVIGSPIVVQNYGSVDKRRIQEEITRGLENSLKALREWYLNGAVGTPP